MSTGQDGRLGIFAALATFAMLATMTERAGMRERKKTATRAALSEAAIRLAVAHGLDGVTTDAIAAAADVAPRTFRNYFSNKEEAVLAQLSEHAGSFAALIRARPTGEPVWESVRAACIGVLGGWIGEFAKMRQREDLFLSSPSLAAHLLAVCEQAEQLMAEAIAERAGTDSSTDPYPRLQAGVAMLAIKTAMEFWHRNHGDVDAAQLVHQALELIQAGLPQPQSDQ